MSLPERSYMKVKFVFESELSWITERIITVQDNVSEEDIEAMFPLVLNVPYNKNSCTYEAIDGHIFTESEVLGYTD